MATSWFITKEFLLDNQSNAEKLTADTTGTGSDLFKVYRDAAREYDEVSKLFHMRDTGEEQLQEKENIFVLAQSAWAAWVTTNTP
jgi:hypothetical protein